MYKQSQQSKTMSEWFYPVKIDIYITQEDRIKRMVEVDQWLEENVVNVEQNN